MLYLTLAVLLAFFTLERARGETYTDLTNSLSLPYDPTLFDVEISSSTEGKLTTGQAIFRPKGAASPLFYSSKQYPFLLVISSLVDMSMLSHGRQLDKAVAVLGNIMHDEDWTFSNSVNGDDNRIFRFVRYQDGVEIAVATAVVGSNNKGFYLLVCCSRLDQLEKSDIFELFAKACQLLVANKAE